MCHNSRYRAGVSGADLDGADCRPTVLKSSLVRCDVSLSAVSNSSSATGKILDIAMRMCVASVMLEQNISTPRVAMISGDRAAVVDYCVSFSE
jgi:hypothetical protein